MKNKIFLLVQVGYKKLYNNSKISTLVSINNHPRLTYAVLSGAVKSVGYEVKYIDLNGIDTFEDLNNVLKSEEIEYVGFSVTTPIYSIVKKVANYIKGINPKIKIIYGGPHITLFPEQVLMSSEVDIVVIGEGEITLKEILLGKQLDEICGIGYKVNGRIIINNRRKLIENLDELEFPDWSIFKINKYKSLEITNKLLPVAPLETSRGCPFNCVYCSKETFGNKFRKKSPKRVLDEIKNIVKYGFKEIEIVDDCFTLDRDRVIEICDMIIKESINVFWSLRNGVRVDTVDKNLLLKMKKAGCYRIMFGIESGSEKVLKSIKKNISLQQVKKAVYMCKKVGIETMGYFMLGLPQETEEDIKKTIDFAKLLPLNYVKISTVIPFPGTELFNILSKKKLIKILNYDDFNFHLKPKNLYSHPILSWDIIEKYERVFYRKFYFRIKIILEMLSRIKSFKQILFFVNNIVKDIWKWV